MHYKPCRFIDNDDVVVDVDDRHVDIRFSDERFWSKVRFDIDLNCVAIGNSTRARGNNDVVAYNEALIEPFGDACATCSGDHRNDSIDAFSG